MNTQKPEPRIKDSDGAMLDLHSIFFTLQGEGPFAGHRAVFIRLAGCNLKCPGCDTEYTNGRERVPIAEIRKRALAAAGNVAGCLIVITGGEPMRQAIGPLIASFVDPQEDPPYNPVQVESNGVFEPDPVFKNLMTNPVTGPRTHLVISPKTNVVNYVTAMCATAFKYVLDHRSVSEIDGLPILALDHPASKGVARPPFGVPVYVNPFDSGEPEHNAANLRAVAETCMKHSYVAGVQLHKLLNLA